MLPDDVIAAEKPRLQQMVEAYEETGGNMVAAMIAPEKTSSYGILDVKDSNDAVVSVNGMAKPRCRRALKSCGDWALHPVTFGAE